MTIEENQLDAENPLSMVENQEQSEIIEDAEENAVRREAHGRAVREQDERPTQDARRQEGITG